MKQSYDRARAVLILQAQAEKKSALNFLESGDRDILKLKNAVDLYAECLLAADLLLEVETGGEEIA